MSETAPTCVFCNYELVRPGRGANDERRDAGQHVERRRCPECGRKQPSVPAWRVETAVPVWVRRVMMVIAVLPGVMIGSGVGMDVAGRGGGTRGSGTELALLGMLVFMCVCGGGVMVLATLKPPRWVLGVFPMVVLLLVVNLIVGMIVGVGTWLLLM